MDKTMKAAVVRAFGQPLVIEEVTVPRPGAGEQGEPAQQHRCRPQTLAQVLLAGREKFER